MPPRSWPRIAPHVERGRPFPIATGTAMLLDESDGSTSVMINGVPSSPLHPNPDVLIFEYMRHTAAALGLHLEMDRALVLHAGAAACTLPRHLVHRWPRSRHLAFEIDPELARMAREWWNLPRSPQLRIRVADAAEAILSRADNSADAIVRDSFSHDIVPYDLMSPAWWHATARVVRPGGIVVANAGALPASSIPGDDARAAKDAWPQVAVVADPAVLKGKRRGNIVMVAGTTLDVNRLRSYAASAELPTVVSTHWPGQP